jgi:hypothetical protein
MRHMNFNILLISVTILLSNFFAHSQSNDCYKKLESSFQSRGSYTVEDAVHKNVIVSYFKPEGSYCYNGKARIENGCIVTIFIQLEDETYELFDKKFYNSEKKAPTVDNGISELISTDNGDKFKVVFIDKLKPKNKSFKEAELPDDL